jgi:glycosyltransferase involved in cell wall biosynthesis
MPIAGYYKKNALKIYLKLLQIIVDTFLVKYILKANIIWTVHNLYSHEMYYPNLEKIGRRIFAKRVDIIISHCNEARDKIKNGYHINSKKIYVIPHGNYFNCYKNSISKNKAREYLNLNQNDFIFLQFGRIRPYKGIENLIQSFNSLEDTDNTKLLIVGKPINEKFKNFLIQTSRGNKKIIFKFEFIQDDEIQIYMNAADIAVIQYREILTSGQCLLAISFGKPIIAPRLGCINDILDEKGSILYDINDKTGLIKALKTGIKKRNQLNEMGKYNLKLAEKFNWNLIAKRTRELYDKF